MPSDRASGDNSTSRSSSFGKIERDDEAFQLQVLQPERSSSSSPFVNVARPSSDSARADDHDAPLLPMSLAPPENSPARWACTPAAIWAWIKGPVPPHKYRITPYFRDGQTAVTRLVHRYFPSAGAKRALLLAALGLWSAIFLFFLNLSVSGQEIPEYGRPVKLSCYGRLWTNATDCGFDGDNCRPFNEGSFAFCCPASCASSMVLEPYFVGPQEINYRSLVIGGAPDGVSRTNVSGVYRGDSAICPAAIHAGIVDDQTGGCAVLHRAGEQRNFESIRSHKINSIAFPSYFPLSFNFERIQSCAQHVFQGRDLRWPLFTFTLIVSTVLSMSIASPAAFYATMYFIVYFQVALVSDPPYSPDFYEVVSIALGRFLPCAFVGWGMYYFAVRHTLWGLDAHWDKTILWLGPCWVGALNTDTFDKIPLSRLTPHDIKQQPGAIPALITIVVILVGIVVTQALAFRNEGRLPRMLSLYGIMTLGILALVAVPHMNLRIHHYILSLLFLPGTTLQTRPSLLYQGLLIGLFVNGIARWGFDSILQTPSALLNGARLGSALPQIETPWIPSSDEITLSFLNVPDDADGIAVLVNDVVRFQAFKSNAGEVEPFEWTRLREEEAEYFRFGYLKMNALGGIWYEDFTRPATWDPEGWWIPPT